MSKRLGVAGAIAEHLGCDVLDVRDSRYHYGHTGTLQIYSAGDGYITACKGSAKPPKVEGYTYNWHKIDSWIEGVFNWSIYYAEDVEE